MNYLRNAWYVAAWQSDLAASEIFRRTILDEPVLIYRQSSGQLAALRDRCPHRFAPLSKGVIVSDNIQCPYHGLVFNGSGQCVHNPHGNGHIPEKATVHAYPVMERYGAVWIWMGDSDRADPDLLPVFDFMDKNSFYVAGRYLVINANYELETDNILDLSHIEYLHPLFSSPAVSKAEVQFEHEGDTVWSRRFICDDSLPDFLNEAFNIPKNARADRWLDVRWDAPALLALWSGGVIAGGDRSEGVVAPSVHWFTPETATSTHYFYGVSASRNMGDQGQVMAEQIVESLRGPFENEDKPIIEAQGSYVGDRDLQSLRPLILPIDNGGIRARRILRKKINEEQAVSTN